jgi:hypothetical protein
VRVTVIGMGAVGSRVVEALVAAPEVQAVTVLVRELPRGPSKPADAPPDKVDIRRRLPGERLEIATDVTVVAEPAAVRRASIAALEVGSHVICPVDDPIDVRQVLELDERARTAGLTVAVGTAMAPGLSCVLARRLAASFDEVDEVHVASFGTGGPACARRHHAALAGIAIDWTEGTPRRRGGGVGVRGRRRGRGRVVASARGRGQTGAPRNVERFQQLGTETRGGLSRSMQRGARRASLMVSSSRGFVEGGC